MKKQVLSAVILALLMASVANPVATVLSDVPAEAVFYQTPERGAVSLLVEGVDDFEPTEVGFLSGFGTVTTVAGRVAVLHTQSANFPTEAQRSSTSGTRPSEDAPLLTTVTDTSAPRRTFKPEVAQKRTLLAMEPMSLESLPAQVERLETTPGLLQMPA